MTCPQLTTVCIFMTACQIASGQLSFSQRLALSPNYSNFLMDSSVLRRPPPGYHFETMKHIMNTYPSNSYTIKYGLSNIVRNNNNGGSTPSKGGQKKPVKKNKKQKPEDDEDASGDTSSPSDSPPTADPTTGSPTNGTPPADEAPAT